MEGKGREVEWEVGNSVESWTDDYCQEFRPLDSGTVITDDDRVQRQVCFGRRVFLQDQR